MKERKKREKEEGGAAVTNPIEASHRARIVSGVDWMTLGRLFDVEPG